MTLRPALAIPFRPLADDADDRAMRSKRTKVYVSLMSYLSLGKFRILNSRSRRRRLLLRVRMNSSSIGAPFCARERHERQRPPAPVVVASLVAIAGLVALLGSPTVPLACGRKQASQASRKRS